MANPFRRLRRAQKGPSIPVSSEAAADVFGLGAATAAGIQITPENALRITTVYACVRLIAEGIGAMPTHLFRRAGRFRQLLDDHQMRPVLTEQPNPEMDAGELWRQLTGWMLLRGNSYALPEFDPRGRLTALWPIPSTRVTPARNLAGELVYVVRLGRLDHAGAITPEVDVVLIPEELLHFRAFGLGPVGLSPIALAAEACGITIAAEEYGARFFSNDARPGGVIKVDGKLDDASWNRLRTRWEKLHQGARRSHLVAILEGGASWEKVGVNPEEAQFLELRRFQVAEIARLYGVPPHMVADVTGSTSWGTGIEVQGIGFVVWTLMPWITRLERVTKMRLLRAERDVNFRFNVAGLLRGDTKSRYEAYAVGRQNGFLSGNDIRSLEDLDPIEGPAGDEFFVPANLIPAGTSLEDRMRIAGLWHALDSDAVTPGLPSSGDE